MAIDYMANSTGLLSECDHLDDVWSPNYYTGAKPNTGICVHHMASTSFNAAGARFRKSSEQASTHYGVGPGYYTQYVSERDGSWGCGCDWGNYRLIQIETVNSSGSPNWLIAEKSYDTLARLMADIAIRHGWKRLIHGENVWGHREMTAHGAAPTACPGPYLYPRLDALCARANEYIASTTATYEHLATIYNESEYIEKQEDGTMIQTYSVKVTPSEKGGIGKTHIDFETPFKGTPAVVGSCVSGGPGNYAQGPSFSDVSKTGCNVLVRRPLDSSSTSVFVVAIGE